MTGLFRDIHYVDKTKNKGKDVIGWGTQFSTVASLGDYVKFMGQASYGKGIAAYISSMGYKPISFVPKEDDPGKLQASPMLGWFAGFKFLPSDDWSINLTYGTSRVWKVSHAYPDFKYGLDARISAFYKMTPWLQSGIEYLWGKHQTFDQIGRAHV